MSAEYFPFTQHLFRAPCRTPKQKQTQYKPCHCCQQLQTTATSSGMPTRDQAELRIPTEITQTWLNEQHDSKALSHTLRNPSLRSVPWTFICLSTGKYFFKKTSSNFQCLKLSLCLFCCLRACIFKSSNSSVFIFSLKQKHLHWSCSKQST